MKQRIRLSESNLHRVIKESVKTVLKEYSFKEQWEDEINIFMNGLRRGRAIVDNGLVAVEWGHDEKDPRYIYYKEGDNCLTDDHFSQQHSRRLTYNEIREIQDYAQRHGVDIEIPEDEYYHDIYGDFDDEDEDDMYESVKRPLKEGIYDYPDGIDHIILLAENDQDCYNIYIDIVRMLVKHYNRGEEVSIDRLVNSSVMKKYQQFCFRKFRSEQMGQGVLTKDSPKQFRIYMAEKMLDGIKDGEYDYLITNKK